MTTIENSKMLCVVLGSVAIALSACGSSNNDGGSGGGANQPTGGAATTTSGGLVGSGGALAATGGNIGNGGTTVATGGMANAGGVSAGTSAGGASGSSSGGTSTGAGGSKAGGTAGSSAAGMPNSPGGAGGGCVVGKWPAADPAATGPYAVVTENEVGPEAGAEEEGVVPKFTMFRPKELGPNGLCHPVITWGNGTGSTPSTYRSLLNLFASHGFIVIGSNSKNVGQGTPRPMLVGVDWVLQQNEDPSSALYHHIDTTHIGATGHSQGAFATSQAAGDSRITTNVPIEGAQVQRNLHGPAMFFCGGMDDIVGCDGAKSALNAVTTLPAMYAEYLSVDHGSWLSFGNKPSPVYAAVNAWMRVHLMGDDSLRSWFYGASCTLCSDAGWQIDRKNMDQ